MVEMTIFTTPKPFTDPVINMIQRNAIGSWTQLSGRIEILLIGDDPGVAETALELGVRHVPDVERNLNGTPRVDSIFRIAKEESPSRLLCYVNADILILDDFLRSVSRVDEQFDQFLIAGQRWDLGIDSPLDFKSDWVRELRSRIRPEGRLHPPAGSDYFVFRRDFGLDLPPFALGRAGWDNWLIYAGRRARIPVVDATQAITVVHQDHGYDHLPQGEIHYRLPESRENVRLAGGHAFIFRLTDSDWRLIDGNLVQKRPGEQGLRRWIEVSLISRLGPGIASRLVRGLFHPVGYVRYYRLALKRRASGIRDNDGMRQTTRRSHQNTERAE